MNGTRAVKRDKQHATRVFNDRTAHDNCVRPPRSSRLRRQIVYGSSIPLSRSSMRRSSQIYCKPFLDPQIRAKARCCNSCH
jgi:hypothetical protein